MTQLAGWRETVGACVNLKALSPGVTSRTWLQFSEAIEGDGAQVWRVACDMGLEGIVSKRNRSP